MRFGKHQANVDLDAKIARSVRADLADSSELDHYLAFEHSLGKGSDDGIRAFLHCSNKRLIAVKTPHPNRISASINVLQESKILKAISSRRKHENIIT